MQVTLWQQIGVSNGVFNTSALDANGISGLSQAQAAGNNAIAAFNAGSLTVNYWLVSAQHRLCLLSVEVAGQASVNN